jgi:hypothetical protein
MEGLHQSLQGCQLDTTMFPLSSVAMVNVDLRLLLHRRRPLLHSYTILP